MELNNITNSKNFKGIILAIGVIIFALLIFKAGIFIGYYRASFSNQWGDRYEKTFGDRAQDENFRGMGMMRNFSAKDNFSSGNGVSGKILDISLPSIIIEGHDNVEKIINVNKDTLIRKFKEEIGMSDLRIGDSIIVIGSPDKNAEIDARLIRIMSYSSTTTTSNSTTTKIK